MVARIVYLTDFDISLYVTIFDTRFIILAIFPKIQNYIMVNDLF